MMKRCTIIVFVLAIQGTKAFSFGRRFFNGDLKNMQLQPKEKKLRIGGDSRNTIDNFVGVVRSSVV